MPIPRHQFYKGSKTYDAFEEESIEHFHLADNRVWESTLNEFCNDRRVQGINFMGENEVKSRRLLEESAKAEKKDNLKGFTRLENEYMLEVDVNNCDPWEFFRKKRADPVANQIGLKHLGLFERIFQNK